VSVWIPHLEAAVNRFEEVENWATIGAVLTAAKAVCGDSEAQAILRDDPAWALDSDGRLPTR
jgi:hypothetical protein